MTSLRRDDDVAASLGGASRSTVMIGLIELREGLQRVRELAVDLGHPELLPDLDRQIVIAEAAKKLFFDFGQ
jgi:hypothetical protein